MNSTDKYRLLISTLDAIIAEAPIPSNKYDTSDDDKTNQARSRALIQLYLRTRFGLVRFDEAEELITDGTNDGGLDAYYIDELAKKVYLIQSKFRSKEENFEKREVNGYELFKMDLGPITRGEEEAGGIKFNGKILGYQRKIRSILDIGRYQFILVFLGNVPKNLDLAKLNEVSGNVCDEVIVLNGRDTYNELLLPYLQSNFYNKKDFSLKIKLNKNQSNRINHSVDIDGQKVNIDVSFIPTREIAKMMWEYKNSLLEYNPRCYVGIKTGGVNKDIQKSIIDSTSNEFALLNNGITMICKGFAYTENNADPDSATITVDNPQIVNGGQTAYTLSKIFADSKVDNFIDKEVLVKFISISKKDSTQQAELIEKISKATNSQTPVGLSDRKSNDQKLVDLQRYLFENYGILLERKKGEFYDALDNKIVTSDIIVKKEQLMRLIFAMKGNASEARSFSNDRLFKVYPISRLENSDFDEIYKVIKIQNIITSLQGKGLDKYRNDEFGYGLNYGKYAIISTVYRVVRHEELDNYVELIDEIMSRWRGFEVTVSNEDKNSVYFDDGFNYDNYYKGKTINDDLLSNFELTK